MTINVWLHDRVIFENEEYEIIEDFGGFITIMSDEGEEITVAVGDVEPLKSED
jgi:hypothetical protein